MNGIKNHPAHAIYRSTLSHFNKSLKKLVGVERLAHLELREKINQVTRDYNRARKKKTALEFKNFADLLNLDQVIRYEKSQRGEINKRMIKAREDKLLNQELSATNNNLTLAIAPSSQHQGNITGARFPKGTWALTFDDGPRVKTTTMILDLLEEYGQRADFFWTAQNALKFPALVFRAKHMGMTLANHSYTHFNLPKADAPRLVYEIDQSTTDLEQLYNRKVDFFRLPYGAGMRKPTIRHKITENQMMHVFWNVDGLDWQDKNPASILKRMTLQMKRQGKGIILLHDIHLQSAKAARLLLEYIQEKNRINPDSLRLQTLPEIVDNLNENGEN